ncbi:ABC transporter ATP-binding protein [Shimazuella kribbensis]|uniref:ABC transporter ATP-binding protein n=1 Tax=Shimazuella kribbensis TaxID=139808 RepID=UPI001471C15F|nr:ABC transporter ATP-binding protein [Shimazuella kribbensis]
MRLAWRWMWEKKLLSLVILFCVMMDALVSFLRPYMTKLFIDEGVSQGENDILLLSILGFMFASVFGFMFMRLGDVLEELMNGYVDLGLQGNLREKPNQVSELRLFHKFHSTELPAGVPIWTSKISSAISTVIPDLLNQKLNMVVSLGAMLWISPVLTVICVFCVGLLFLSKRVLKKYAKLNKQMFEQQNKIMSHTVDFFRSFRDIQMCGAIKRENDEFKRLRTAYMKTNLKAAMTKIFGIDSFSVLMEAIITGAIFLMGMLYFQIISPGQSFQFAGYAVTFQVGVNWFFQRFQSVLEFVPDVDRCDEILHLEEIPLNLNPIDLEEVETIEFRNVTATHLGSNVPAIHNVSFLIRKGETIGLVGPSGSGKTTVIYLLGRMLEPDSGEVLINGRSIKDFTLESMRERFAFCFQDTDPLDRSIIANLELANPEATDTKIQKALFDASLDLPKEKLQGKTDLSGGQKQRLGIARSLLRPNAEVFILDEFTSALDAKTESQMIQRMDRRLQGKTRIIIAHRFSTIRTADRIVVMDSGKIVQTGPHEELRRQKKGLYYELWKTQKEQSWLEKWNGKVLGFFQK